MTGWTFRIQAPGSELAQTVCVAIDDKLQAGIRALQAADGVMVSEEPLSPTLSRRLRMKQNDVRLL